MDDKLLNTAIRDWLPAVQGRLLGQTRYFGVPVVKCPLDWWMYQEIVYERQPDAIIEVGNFRGGMLLALAHWCDVLARGVVFGVDIDHSPIAPQVHRHKRIRLVTGDAAAVAGDVAAAVMALGVGDRPEVLVIEDSSHECQQTLDVLNAYAPLVQPHGYMIVEDTICQHGLAVGPRPGPAEAVQMFLAQQPKWRADRTREAFGVTWNAGGYLRRSP